MGGVEYITEIEIVETMKKHIYIHNNIYIAVRGQTGQRVRMNGNALVALVIYIANVSSFHH